MDRKTRLRNKTHIAPINKPFNGSGEFKKSIHHHSKRIPLSGTSPLHILFLLGGGCKRKTRL